MTPDREVIPDRERSFETAPGGSLSLGMDAPMDAPISHVHVHAWSDGERSYRHAHVMPDSSIHRFASRAHSHLNGRHSHPHGHREFRR